MSQSRKYIAETSEMEGSCVSISGHIQSVRNLGKISFITVRDATGEIQCVLDSNGSGKPPEGLVPEAPVVVAGKVVESPNKKDQVEMQVEDFQVVAEIEAPLPIELAKNKKVDQLGLSTLLDYRPLTLRNEKVKSIFKIESVISRAFREFLTKQNFTEIHTPKIVATGTEGGAQLFKLEYFGKTAYLAQSPQFYKQIMVGVFERVFEVAAVYRAEEHDTTRHLNEYISLDFEMGFINSEQDVISMQVSLMKHIFNEIQECCEKELALWNAKVPEFTEIPQIKLSEALELLTKKYKWTPAQKGNYQDLDPEGERLICEHFTKEEGIELVYILNYPLSARPFYTMPYIANGDGVEKSRGFDLLFRGLEITTGGQRIHEYRQLRDAIARQNLDPEDFAEYLMCFKHGMPPHGGLAIGLERLTKQLLGLKSVKQAALFPRDLNRLKP